MTIKFIILSLVYLVLNFKVQWHTIVPKCRNDRFYLWPPLSVPFPLSRLWAQLRNVCLGEFSNQYSSTQLFKFGILVIEQILLFLNILTVHIEKDENRWIHFIIWEQIVPNIRARHGIERGHGVETSLKKISTTHDITVNTKVRRQVLMWPVATYIVRMQKLDDEDD